ncbi:profilin [Nannocystis punicea]|uniref:Profilin n=1 Tax=Nannocystis punicea TaxID=2995304 RepID=A0ABY7H8B3_9BACT|nr:profilin [Nannocystis poenicansa]WAS95327.1 profilin [Nannocystis poenicansa]
MSSWKPYLEWLLADRGVKCAGIFGQDGATWGASDGFELTAPEVTNIVAGLRDKANLSAGVTAGGNKFLFVTRLPEGSLVARRGATSLLGILTTKAVIVLLTRDNYNPGSVDSHSAVAEKLIQLGF